MVTYLENPIMLLIGGKKLPTLISENICSYETIINPAPANVNFWFYCD